MLALERPICQGLHPIRLARAEQYAAYFDASVRQPIESFGRADAEFVDHRACVVDPRSAVFSAPGFQFYIHSWGSLSSHGSPARLLLKLIGLRSQTTVHHSSPMSDYIPFAPACIWTPRDACGIRMP